MPKSQDINDTPTDKRISLVIYLIIIINLITPKTFGHNLPLSNL